jgi:hypothetical protein
MKLKAPANGVWKQRERGEDPSLDCGIGLRAGGDSCANGSDWRPACTRFYRFSASRFSKKRPFYALFRAIDEDANFAENANQLILFGF